MSLYGLSTIFCGYGNGRIAYGFGELSTTVRLPATNANHSCTSTMMKDDVPSVTSTRPSPHLLRQIAAKAEVAPETVWRVINGQPTRQSPRERVERAMRDLGLEGLLPGEAS
jgi:hypothetical protein